MKIANVVGVRPQFVKASVVSRALKKNKEECLIPLGVVSGLMYYK
jgi:UDP-GlcNAc3NAcA epimerase